VALTIYEQENHGLFPRGVWVPERRLLVGTNAAAPDPFGAGGPGPNDVTANAFVLIRAEKLPTSIIADPYTDEIPFSPDTAVPSMRSNFADWHLNLAFSFADPYPDLNAVHAGYKVDGKLPAAFVVAADRNPGTGAGNNSRNHEGEGQNVLWSDGHVEWQTTTQCGVNGDDIYVNQAGRRREIRCRRRMTCCCRPTSNRMRACRSKSFITGIPIWKFITVRRSFRSIRFTAAIRWRT